MTEPLNPAGDEYRMPPGMMLVSRTDASGVITYANDAFAEASGYAIEELIGQTHKLDRHPQVPGWVFDGMWRRLKEGQPWRGVLFNRRKNGNHYWVDAFIVPVKRNGVTIEYMSVRLDATPEQIAAAKADFALPGAPMRGRFSPRRFLSVKRGVLTGVLFVTFAMLVAVAIGQRNLDRSSHAFNEVHAYREILASVAQADRSASIAQNQLLMVLRHAPKNERTTAEDAIEVPEHLERVRKAQNDMVLAAGELSRHEAVKRYLGGAVTAGESAADTTRAAVLIKGYLDAVDRIGRRGFNPAVQHIEQGRLDAGEETVVGEIGTLADRLHVQSALLAKYFDDSADRHQHEMGDLMQSGSRLVTSWIAFVILVIVISSIWFFRDTIRPLRRAIEAMQRISAGNLNERLDIYGVGEPGEVVSALATMQIHLKVMLDEIRLNSANVHAQIGKLNQTVITVLNTTEDAHGQASQILSSLEDTGADTTRLATVCADVLQRIQATAPTGEAESLNALASEAAALASLNDFAASEVRRMSHNIMEYLVESRESVNDAWTAGQNLEKTSNSLKKLLARFD